MAEPDWGQNWCRRMWRAVSRPLQFCLSSFFFIPRSSHLDHWEKVYIHSEAEGNNWIQQRLWMGFAWPLALNFSRYCGLMWLILSARITKGPILDVYLMWSGGGRLSPECTCLNSLIMQRNAFSEALRGIVRLLFALNYPLQVLLFESTLWEILNKLNLCGSQDIFALKL